MVTRDDDEPNDPRPFRRTLVPLDIQDADGPPSLGQKIGGLFRKKAAKDGPPKSSPESADEDASAQDREAEGGNSGQYL